MWVARYLSSTCACTGAAPRAPAPPPHVYLTLACSQTLETRLTRFVTCIAYDGVTLDEITREPCRQTTKNYWSTLLHLLPYVLLMWYSFSPLKHVLCLHAIHITLTRERPLPRFNYRRYAQLMFENVQVSTEPEISPLLRTWRYCCRQSCVHEAN